MLFPRRWVIFGEKSETYMKFEYKPKGTCSTKLELDLGDDGKMRNLRFTNGCDGNLKAVAMLTDGMDAREIIGKLKGIKCGRKRTSCPDQLACALEQALIANA